MDAARYARLGAWFEEARGLDARARAALLQRVSAEDAELAGELALLCASLEPAAEVETADVRALLHEPAIGAARAHLEELAQEPGAADGIPGRIGSYRILRRIGQGGMGVVYEAEQSAPQRRVALKMIPPSFGGVERLKRFRLEGEVLGRLHHPNIAQVFECGTADLGHGPQPYFAMEYVEGIDLYSFALRADLGIDAKLALVARVADAVQHAHERGVVHRDLKPDNVLVEASGEPKVLDFGVARASDTSHVLTSAMTQTGELVGTLAYMAPEQLSGSRGAVGPRVDVYALGVILYQLLAARLPHEVAGLPLTAAIQILTHAEPLPLARHDPRCAGDVATIVAKAMEKDPSRRYASAAELAADLRRHLEHLPIAARPASAIYRLKKSLRRNRGLVVGLAAVFVTLVGGLAATLWQTRAAHASATEAEANADRALRQAYSANMLLAGGALDRAELAAARSNLEAAPESLRGWEWRVLAARLDSSARTQLRNLPHPERYNHLVRLELLLDPDGVSYWTFDAAPMGRTRRWDLGSGALLAEFLHPDPLASRTNVALAPDGSRIWMASGDLLDGTGPVHWSAWETATGRPVELVGPADLAELAGTCDFIPAPDGSLWLNQRHLIAVTHAGRPQIRTRLHPDSVLEWISFDRSGSRVVLSCDGGAWIHDLATLEVVASLDRCGTRVMGAAFSEDGRRFATGDSDGYARVWDLTGDAATLLLKLEHDHEVVSVAFSPDGERLATLAFDRNIRIWDLSTGTQLDTFGTEDLARTALTFLSAREVAGLKRNGSLVTWDLTARATTTLEGHGNTLTGAVPLARAGLIASGAWDGFHGHEGALRLWDTETGEPVAACLGIEEAVYALAVAPDGKTLAVSLNGPPKRAPYLLLIDVTDGRTSRLRLSATSYSIAFDPTSSRAVLSQALRATLVVPVEPGAEPREIPLISRCVAWSPDGRFLALGCRPEDGQEGPGTVLYEADSLREVRRFASRGTIAVAFSPDGQRLATAGQDAIVRLWDVESGAQLAPLTGHDLEVIALAFSPDGQRLASAGVDSAIRLWDPRSLTPVGMLSGHAAPVTSLAWEEERLISASSDSSVRLWEPEPVRARLAARETRQATAARVRPLVARLLAEHESPEEVLAALAREADLDGPERKVAHQLALGAALERALK